EAATTRGRARIFAHRPSRRGSVRRSEHACVLSHFVQQRVAQRNHVLGSTDDVLVTMRGKPLLTELLVKRGRVSVDVSPVQHSPQRLPPIRLGTKPRQ